MSSEFTVHLVKDYVFQLTGVSSQGWMSRNFKAKEVNLTRNPSSASGSSYVNGISEYVKARSPDYALLTFTARIKKFGPNQTDFDVQFTENFVKCLCDTFPSYRFIQIRGKISQG